MPNDLFDLIGKDGRRIDLHHEPTPQPNQRPAIRHVDRYKASVNGDKFRLKVWGETGLIEIWLTHPQALALKDILAKRTAHPWNTPETPEEET